LRRYQKKGLDKLERRMVADVGTEGLEHARVLEIGGGVGTIQAELLTAGAERGEVIEVVPAYEPYALQLARIKGIESRTTFRVVDVLEQPDRVAPADIVVLNRVVCCSPDGVRLTAVSARLADRRLLMSYPRDRWLARLVVRLTNSVFRMMGKSFRVFLHPRQSLHAAALAEGLVVADTGNTIAWEFATFRRAQPAIAGPV
jgi:magnesium-protoporphyrin O-methyltransferase